MVFNGGWQMLMFEVMNLSLGLDLSFDQHMG